MTDHSCQWISPLISSRPAHHTLEPGSGCSPGTQSHVQAHLPSQWALPAQLWTVLWRGDLFQASTHKVTVSASRLHHIVFSPAFINLICVILPTHDCTESAEIFGVSLCIRLIEGCYVRMSTFLRKKRELFNLHGCKVKFEIVMGMFLFLRTRCLMFLKRERTFSWLQKTFMFLVSDSWLFSTGIAPDVKLCELKIFRGELKKTPTSCLLCWPNLLCWNS